MFKSEQTFDQHPLKMVICLVNYPIVWGMRNVELPTLQERAYPPVPKKRDLSTEYSRRALYPTISLRTVRLSIFPLVTSSESQFVAIGDGLLIQTTRLGWGGAIPASFLAFSPQTECLMNSQT